MFSAKKISEAEELGFIEISMEGFLGSIMDEQPEDRFKKANFAIFDFEDRKIGDLNLSLSLIQVSG